MLLYYLEDVPAFTGAKCFPPKPFSWKTFSERLSVKNTGVNNTVNDDSILFSSFGFRILVLCTVAHSLI